MHIYHVLSFHASLQTHKPHRIDNVCGLLFFASFPGRPLGRVLFTLYIRNITAALQTDYSKFTRTCEGVSWRDGMKKKYSVRRQDSADFSEQTGYALRQLHNNKFNNRCGFPRPAFKISPAAGPGLLEKTGHGTQRNDVSQQADKR